MIDFFIELYSEPFLIYQAGIIFIIVTLVLFLSQSDTNEPSKKVFAEASIMGFLVTLAIMLLPVIVVLAAIAFIGYAVWTVFSVFILKEKNDNT